MAGEGSLFGSLAGGALGLFLAPTGLGPVGWAVGSAIGGYIGGTLDKPPGQDFVGPRLNDLRQQRGGYGQMLPILFGNMRIAGTVIFTPASLTETGQYVTQDAQGNTIPSTLVFIYSTNIATAWCESGVPGGIIGYRKFWCNGDLIADYSSGGSLSVHSRAFPGAGGIRMYFGDSTQLQDPYLLTANPNEPAYRDTAYTVLLDLQLGRFSNQRPNIEAEVVTAGNAVPETLTYLDTVSQLGLAANGIITPGGNLLIASWVSGSGASKVVSLTLRDPTTLAVITTFTPGTTGGNAIDLLIAPLINSVNDILYCSIFSGTWIWPSGGSPTQIGIGAAAARGFVDTSGNFYCAFLNMASSAYILARIAPGATTYTTLQTYANFAQNTPGDLYDGNDGYLYYFRGTTGGTIEKIRRSDGVLIHTYTPAAQPTTLCTAGDGSIWYLSGSSPVVHRIAADWSAEAVIYSTGTAINNERLSRDWSTGDVLYTGGILVPGTGAYRFHSDGTIAGNTLAAATVGYVIYTHPNFPLRKYAWNHLGLGHTQFLTVFSGGGTVGTTPLADVITALCARGGLAPADLDVTLLSGLALRGYAISQQQELREMIMPLLTAYFVDMVESAGKLKFVPRGGATVATITQADMGARPSDSEAQEPYSIVRTAETELPRQITLSYYDVDHNYAITNVYARRQVTQSVNDVTMNLALALTATDAQRIVNTMLYEAWSARTRISFSLSQKYALLEPTDVVDLSLAEGTFTVRLLGKKDGAGVMQFESAVIDAALYTQTAVGDGGPDT